MIACAAPSSVVAPPNPTAMASSASSSASAYASSSSCTDLAMALPQRPGEPDCSFYIKTGICKFGMNCRYHHPKNPSMSPLSSKLSPMGLPLRPVSFPSSLIDLISISSEPPELESIRFSEDPKRIDLR